MKLITFTRPLAVITKGGETPLMVLVVEGSLRKEHAGLVDIDIKTIHLEDKKITLPQCMTVTTRSSMIASSQDLYEQLKAGELDPRD